MTTPHRATPEQWANVERFVEECGYDACLLELRDRLAAAEQRISELEGNSSAGLTGSNHLESPDSSAPAGSLVERVRTAIVEHGDGQTYVDEARAAIYEVANWLDSRGVTTKVRAARLLREELE